MTFTSVLKRAGTLLLGVIFWFMMLLLVLEIAAAVFAVVRWASPESHRWSWTILYIPVEWYENLIHGLFWFLTAAIGWVYVFPHKYKPLWVFIILWGVLMILGFPQSFPRADVPTDQELVEHFQRHEAAFRKLVEMANEDVSLNAINSPAILREHGVDRPLHHPEDAISEERKQEYFQLLEETGVMLLYRPYFREHTVEYMLLFAFERELARMIIKGYVYSTDDRLPVVASLDNLPAEVQGPVFKRIEGNWYLYYLWSNY